MTNEEMQALKKKGEDVMAMQKERSDNKLRGQALLDAIEARKEQK